MYRVEWGRLLALLVARTRRLDLAEDALAEAFVRASARWPSSEVPGNPAGWLYRTAHREIIGRLRAEAVAGRKAPLLAVQESDRQLAEIPVDELPDERLELLLLCCHPALDPAARSALALRLGVGTSTDEIARLFLVPVPTMAARLTRAKRKIVAAGIPFRRPVGDELAVRVESVARTIYLAFTTGYAPASGPDLLRADLAGEAVHLARVLRSLLPGDPLTAALLSLLLFQHSRRDARVSAGTLVPLPDQDRRLWRQDEIEEAGALLDTTPPLAGFAEELRLQASIAREHAAAATAANTSWEAIAEHYGELHRLTGSPVVKLNGAVAVMEVEGPEAALQILAGLDDALGKGHRLHAVRADAYRRLGRTEDARLAYAFAIERCANDAEREFLITRRSLVTENRRTDN